MLILIVLTGCQTQKLTFDDAVKTSLIDMFPSLPVLPSWPKIQWTYQNGKYCLSESDANKVLTYFENEMPLYEFHMNQYRNQLQIILDSLKQ